MIHIYKIHQIFLSGFKEYKTRPSTLVKRTEKVESYLPTTTQITHVNNFKDLFQWISY